MRIEVNRDTNEGFESKRIGKETGGYRWRQVAERSQVSERRQVDSHGDK